MAGPIPKPPAPAPGWWRRERPAGSRFDLQPAPPELARCWPAGPLMGSPAAFALLVVALATGTANYLAGEADRAATARANATIAGVERLVPR